MLPAALYNQLAGGAVTTDPIMQAAAAALASSNGSGNDVVGSGSRDTTFTKIFVGGLPYHTSDKTLHEYFEQFGDIEEAVVITDRQTQKSRGYGFVTMKSRADAEKACKDPNPIIDGRKANVNLAYLGAKPRGNIQLAGELPWALSSAGLPLPLQSQLQALFPAARLGEAYGDDRAATAVSAASAMSAAASLKMGRKDEMLAAGQERTLYRISPYTVPIRHLPQLYYPQNAALMNHGLLGAAGLQQASAAQHQFLDYQTLAAAMAAGGQNAAALGINQSVAAQAAAQNGGASGLEYGYPYGVVPSAAQYQLQTQLAAAVPKIDH